MVSLARCLVRLPGGDGILLFVVCSPFFFGVCTRKSNFVEIFLLFLMHGRVFGGSFFFFLLYGS